MPLQPADTDRKSQSKTLTEQCENEGVTSLMSNLQCKQQSQQCVCSPNIIYYQMSHNRHSQNHKLVFNDMREVAELVVDALKQYHGTTTREQTRTVDQARQYADSLHQKRHELEKSTSSKMIEKLRKEEERRQASSPLKKNRSTEKGEKAKSRSRTPTKQQPTPVYTASPILQSHESKTPQSSIHERSKDLLKAREYRLERERYRQDQKQIESMLSNTFKKSSVEEWLEHLNQREAEHQQRILQQRSKLLSDILHGEAQTAPSVLPEIEMLRREQQLLRDHQRTLMQGELKHYEVLMQSNRVERELQLRAIELEQFKTKPNRTETKTSKPLQNARPDNRDRLRAKSRTPTKPSQRKSVTPTKTPSKQPTPQQQPQYIPPSRPQNMVSESAMTFSASPSLTKQPINHNKLSQEQLLSVLRQNRQKIFRIVDKIRRE